MHRELIEHQIPETQLHLKVSPAAILVAECIKTNYIYNRNTDQPIDKLKSKKIYQSL